MEIGEHRMHGNRGKIACPWTNQANGPWSVVEIYGGRTENVPFAMLLTSIALQSIFSPTDSTSMPTSHSKAVTP
jgi:hypothetical protein